MNTKGINSIVRLTNTNDTELNQSGEDQAKVGGYSPDFIDETIDVFDKIIEHSKDITSGDYKPFDSIDTQQLIDKISGFHQIDTSTLNDQELYNLLSDIVSEVIVSEIQFDEGTELYRARSFDFSGRVSGPFYELEDELWCAPSEKIAPNRMNGKGEKVLYTAFDALAPVHEIRRQPGDKLAMVKYRVKRGRVIKAAVLGCNDISDTDLPDAFIWTENGKRNWRIINDFIRSTITTVSSDRADGEINELYRVTLALSKMHQYPGCEAIFYQSVFRPTSFNLALYEPAIEKLEFVGLGYLQYVGISDDPARKGREYDFNTYQMWSTRIDNRRIVYEPVGKCDIVFDGITNN